MPGGTTHDAVTFLVAAPVFAATFVLTREIPMSVLVTVAFLFGGIMFGPDLDTLS